MYYPLMFEPIYKEMVWGGERLKKLCGRKPPFKHTGESWDISCRENEMGIVKNGIFKGCAFKSVIEKDPAGFMGEKYKNFNHFPLLVKLIDANDFLSVQVHPVDEYARAKENFPLGKNEMWYVLSAEPGGYLIIGLEDGVTKEMFQNALKDNTIESYLHKLYVSPGDVINIPAGLIHAIGKGIVLAEIQQNSDITYRVYDYDRLGLDGKKRELHIEKSLDVIDFSGKYSKKQFECKTIYSDTRVKIMECVKSSYFTTFIYDIKSEYSKFGYNDHFHILTCVDGSAVIEYGGSPVKLTTGDSVFIPAAMGTYKIYGFCRLLESYA